MKVKKVAKKYYRLIEEYGLSSLIEDKIKVIVASYLLSEKLNNFDELLSKINIEAIRELHSVLNDGLLSLSCKLGEDSVLRALNTITKLGDNKAGFRDSLIASISNSLLYAVGISRWSIEEFISESAVEIIITGEEDVTEVNKKMVTKIIDKIINEMKNTWGINKKEFPEDLETKIRNELQKLLNKKLCVE